MSVETWDQLPKNQTDPETIEQAIARLIAVHEADPEAHTGANESLQAHRQNEIIDHPASSIVPDKLNNNSPTYQNFFSGVTNYVVEGPVNQTGQGEIVLIPYTAHLHSLVNIPIANLGYVNFPASDIICDFTHRITKSSGVHFTGVLALGDYTNGFGIEYTETHFRCFYSYEDNLVYSSYIANDLNGLTNWRFYLSAIDKAIYFIKNGVQVATIPFSESGGEVLYQMQFLVDQAGSGSVQCAISCLRLYFNFL